MLEPDVVKVASPVLRGLGVGNDLRLLGYRTTGKGIIEEMRIGSTMEEVVRNAKRPVLVLST
jgi:nucleotide-binding universal stress UspA family protein